MTRPDTHGTTARRGRLRLAVRAGALVTALALAGCGAASSSRPPAGVSAPAPVPPTQSAGPATTAMPAPVLPPPKSCMVSQKPPAVMPVPGHMPAGSTTAAIQKRGYLVAGVDQDSYEFGFRNPSPSPSGGYYFEGLDIDILHAVAHAIFGEGGESRIEFVPVSQNYRMGAAHQGVVDVVADSVSETCQRREEVLFSANYYDASQKLLVPRDSDATVTVDGQHHAHVQGLGGKKVCTVGTTTSQLTLDLLQRSGGFEVVHAGNWSDCLVMVQQGTVQGISTDDTILGGLRAEDPYLKIAGSGFSYEPHGLIFPKSDPFSPGNKQFVGFVNGVLAQLESNGGSWCPQQKQPHDGSCWQALYRTWVEDQLGKATPPTPLYGP